VNVKIRPYRTFILFAFEPFSPLAVVLVLVSTIADETYLDVARTTTRWSGLFSFSAGWFLHRFSPVDCSFG